jgi:hypothetical protein
VALPPPRVRVVAAFGPITATRRRFLGCSGSSGGPSATGALRSSTNEAAAVALISAATAGPVHAAAIASAVGDDVLGAGRHPAGLDAVHRGGADPGGEQRLLAEALDVAAAQRRAVQVDGRCEQDRDPFARACAAGSRPRRSTRAGSQVAASAVGEGMFAEGSRSSQRSPRTPAGPSEVTRRCRPTAGSGCSA